MILTFNVYDQLLKRTDNSYLVNLSKNYLKCKFLFLTENWDDLEKYVVFSVKGENYRYKVNDGVVFDLPNELLLHKYFYVQAYGLDDEEDKHLTTNSIVISLDNAIYKPLFINDSKIEELVNMLGEIVNYKVDGFKVDGNKLICYYDDTALQVIPINNDDLLSFLSEEYIEIDMRKLNSKGQLFYEMYKLQ